MAAHPLADRFSPPNSSVCAADLGTDSAELCVLAADLLGMAVVSRGVELALVVAIVDLVFKLEM